MCVCVSMHIQITQSMSGPALPPQLYVLFLNFLLSYFMTKRGFLVLVVNCSPDINWLKINDLVYGYVAFWVFWAIVKGF